jgi:hypothetical protein
MELFFIIPFPELTGCLAGMLLEEPVKIDGIPKAEFCRDFGGCFTAGDQNLPGLFNPQGMNIT